MLQTCCCQEHTRQLTLSFSRDMVFGEKPLGTKKPLGMITMICQKLGAHVRPEIAEPKLGAATNISIS